MWYIDTCLYSNCFTFSLVLFSHLVFLPFLSLCVFSLLYSFLLLAFLASPFTVYDYALLYRLTLWDLPFLSINRFWPLVSISLGLPTHLLVV